MWQQFRQAVLVIRNRRRDHLREKNIAYPTERPKMLLHFLARKEGYAFFDEDDPCADLWDFGTACLNCVHVHVLCC